MTGRCGQHLCENLPVFFQLIFLSSEESYFILFYFLLFKHFLYAVRSFLSMVESSLQTGVKMGD